ncbi:MAG TPA: permease [Noviherbaspirillum sp.]|nr:permease [Noviherbaspirillum sp.]
MTPFCSCSSIPIFIGFTSAGLPVGVTFSFLISSPLVDLASVILLASIFSWPIALAYVLSGLVLAVVGGTLISRARMEKHIEEFVLKHKAIDLPPEQLTARARINYARDQVFDVIQRVWIFILIGVGIGAAIHNWIPESLITTLIGQENWWSVLVAVLIGLPMYADIFGTLPIAEALVAKGVGIGTVLAFMMAVTALSPPSMVMLKKVVKGPLLATFFGIVTLGIILLGYSFNAFGYLFI